MRSAFAFAALSGLAVAAPKPQVINVDAAIDLPLPSVLGPDVTQPSVTPAAYNPAVAASSAAVAITTDPVAVDKRDGLVSRGSICPLQSGGKGPVPGDGSVAAYLDASNDLSKAAQEAGTPNGYVKSFTNLQGSTQQIGYLTYKNIASGAYDVDGCASFCNSVKFCVGFNIYYERDPSKDPNDASCANPAPITNVKCSLYGYPVASESATNKGQWRGPQDASGESFHVVIVGSNGYSKLAPCPSPLPQTNFTGPSQLLNGAINAPLDPTTGQDTYLGMKLYNSGPYDPSICASACQAQTAYDHATAASDGTYKPCNFFNSYILTKNNVPQGTYCSFYTRTWDSSYAVNTGYWYGSDTYAVLASFTYALTNLDSGKVDN